MKNAILFHGSGCGPNSYWFPSIKKYLTQQDYSVWVPQLPNSELPDLKTQLPFILKNGKFNKETILIGHSSGCPLILSVLENLQLKINKVILVAGFVKPLTKKPNPILQSNYDWDKIKSNFNEIIIINSDDDPLGCNDKQGRLMFDKLGGVLIIPHGQGHMGSTFYKQPYKKFRLLERLL